MPASDSRNLQLQISASAELMIRNLKQADNALADFQKKTDNRLSSIDDKFEALGKLKGALASAGGDDVVQAIGLGDIAAAATAGGLIALAKQGLDYASSLGEVAQQLGVTTKDLQVYRYAATQVGIEQETMDKGLAKLTLTLGQAQTGAKGPIAVFNALGLSMDQLRGKTAGDVIPMLADKLAKISSPAQRAAVEIELFGKAGQKLDTLLAGGSGQIDELSRAAAELGLVLSDDQIQKADDAADKMAAVKEVLSANIASVVADNAASIAALATSLGALTGAVIRFLGSNPQLALGIVGALAGSRVGGLPGAAIGGLAGVAAGEYMARTRDDGNNDLAFRKAELGRAESELAVREGRAAPTRWSMNLPFGLRVRLPETRRAEQTSDGGITGARAEVQRQRALLANASQPKPKPPPGADAPAINAAPGKSAESRAHAAEAAQRKADAAARKDRQEQGRATDMLDRGEQDLLATRADLTNDPQERLRLQEERIDLQRAARDRDLEEAALDNRYVAANLERLKSLNAQNAALDKQLLEQRRAQETDQAEAERRRASVDDQVTLLDIQARLTLIAKDRHAIERRILLMRQQEERDALQRIVDNRAGRYSNEDVATAQQALDRLPGVQAAQRDAQAADQRGVLARYRDGLLSATGDMGEALDEVKVHAFENLEDGLLGLVAGTETVASAFKKMANAIIADLLRIAIEKAILSAIGGSFFGLKDGGPVLRRAGGGPVFGPGGPRDDRVPALLSNGEYVINAAAYDRHPALVEAINSGQLPRFANGGPVLRSISPARLPSLGGASRRDHLHVTGEFAVKPNAMFDAAVQNVTFRTVAAAAEPIMAGAEGRTMKRLARASLPGGLG